MAKHKSGELRCPATALIFSCSCSKDIISFCSSLFVFVVPVVLKTWAKETDNLEFYSEIEDKSIPTIDLGIPNTERGEDQRSIYCIHSN